MMQILKHHVFLLLYCLVCSMQLQAAQDKTFFWKATSEKTTVYLLGSIHFADDSFYPLRSIINDSFTESDHLVVEVDVTRIDLQSLGQFIAKHGSYHNGDDVSRHVSTQTYQRLRDALHKLGIPISLVANKKPSFIVLDITGVLLTRMGLSMHKGIDLNFIEQAHATGKNIVELESMQQQLNMFATLPFGESLLKDTLDNIAHAEREFKMLADAWKQGDEQVLVEQMIDEPEANYVGYDKINQVLLYERNDNMVEKIRAYLQTDESWFVVVGAGHLVGERGIVRQLEKAGFKVERL